MTKKPVNDFDFLTVEYPRRLRVTKRVLAEPITRKKKHHPKKHSTHKKHVKRIVRYSQQRAEYFTETAPQQKVKVRKPKARHAIERRADILSESFPASFEYDDCVHEHHMNCIRCGLVQFMIGFVTGLTMALLMARILF